MNTTMETYSVSFQRAIEKTLGWEGRYSNDPDDPGGETNWGIAKRWHQNVDIKNLTRDGAIAIDHTEYWQPMRLDELRDPRLAGKIFDTVVNQDRRIGPGALQGALILLGQNIKLDYEIGPVTIAAANSYPYPEALLEIYTVLRGMAYLLGAENIEEVIVMIRGRKDRLKKNIRGWWKRLELGALALLLALASGCGTLNFFQARPDNPDEDFLTTLRKVTVADLDRGIEIAQEDPADPDEEVLACYPKLKEYVADDTIKKQIIGPFSAIARSRRVRGKLNRTIPKDLKFACAPLFLDEQGFIRRLAVLAVTRGAVKLPDL